MSPDLIILACHLFVVIVLFTLTYLLPYDLNVQDFSQIASHLTPDDISTVNQDEKTNYTGSSVDLLEKQNIFTKNSLLVLDV